MRTVIFSAMPELRQDVIVARHHATKFPKKDFLSKRRKITACLYHLPTVHWDRMFEKSVHFNDLHQLCRILG